jgi:hypothetical protein
MLPPKKQKIYIGIIIFCIAGIIVVFSLNGSGGQTDFSLDSNNPDQVVPGAFSADESANPTVTEIIQKENGSYSSPSVFPSDNEFDLSIFESSTFKALSVIGDIEIDEDELGKDNPFK